MAEVGQVIENPVSGERFIFRQTARSTRGALLQFDNVVRSHAAVPKAHRHLHQEERFTVLSGTLACRVGGGPARTLDVGASVVVPPGVAHEWWNPGDAEVRVCTAFRPAGALEEFFETLCALATGGQVDATGAPHLLQLALLAPVYDIYLAGPPVALQRAVFALLAPLAQWRGYRVRPCPASERHGG